MDTKRATSLRTPPGSGRSTQEDTDKLHERWAAKSAKNFAAAVLRDRAAVNTSSSGIGTTGVGETGETSGAGASHVGNVDGAPGNTTGEPTVRDGGKKKKRPPATDTSQTSQAGQPPKTKKAKKTTADSTAKKPKKAAVAKNPRIADRNVGQCRILCAVKPTPVSHPAIPASVSLLPSVMMQRIDAGDARDHGRDASGSNPGHEGGTAQQPGAGETESRLRPTKAKPLLPSFEGLIAAREQRQKKTFVLRSPSILSDSGDSNTEETDQNDLDPTDKDKETDSAGATAEAESRIPIDLSRNRDRRNTTSVTSSNMSSTKGTASIEAMDAAEDTTGGEVAGNSKSRIATGNAAKSDLMPAFPIGKLPGPTPGVGLDLRVHEHPSPLERVEQSNVSLTRNPLAQFRVTTPAFRGRGGLTRRARGASQERVERTKQTFLSPRAFLDRIGRINLDEYRGRRESPRPTKEQTNTVEENEDAKEETLFPTSPRRITPAREVGGRWAPDTLFGSMEIMDCQDGNGYDAVLAISRSNSLPEINGNNIEPDLLTDETTEGGNVFTEEGDEEYANENQKRILEVTNALAAHGVEWVRNISEQAGPSGWTPPPGPNKSGWPVDLASTPPSIRRIQEEARARALECPASRTGKATRGIRVKRARGTGVFSTPPATNTTTPSAPTTSPNGETLPSSTTSTLHLLEQAALTLHPHRPNPPRIASSGCTTVAIPDRRFPPVAPQVVSPVRPTPLPPVVAPPIILVIGQVDPPAKFVSTIGAATEASVINLPTHLPTAAAAASVTPNPSTPVASTLPPAAATSASSSRDAGTSPTSTTVQSHMDGVVMGLREGVLKLKAEWTAITEVIHAKRAEEAALRAQADVLKLEGAEACGVREKLTKQITTATDLYNEAKKFRDKAASFMEGARE